MADQNLTQFSALANPDDDTLLYAVPTGLTDNKLTLSVLRSAYLDSYYATTTAAKTAGNILIGNGSTWVAAPYTLPVADGTAGYALVTNGAGATSWVDVGTSGDVAGGANLTTQYRLTYVASAGTITESAAITTSADGHLMVSSASGIKTLAAATQDAIAMVGRAGGTGSFVGTITPAALSASRTYTLPDRALAFAGTGAATTNGTIAKFDSNGDLTDSLIIDTVGAGALTIVKTGTTARTVTFPDAAIVVSGSSSALTSGRVPYATTGGLLTDSANLTTDGTILTAHTLTVSTGALTLPAAATINAATSLSLNSPLVTVATDLAIGAPAMIGTEKLYVAGAILATDTITVSRAGGSSLHCLSSTASVTLRFENNVSSGGYCQYENATMKFLTGGAPRMTIDVSGGTFSVPVSVVSTSGAQLAATYTPGSVLTTFTTDSSGYMTIDPTGGLVTIDGNLTLQAAATITAATSLNLSSPLVGLGGVSPTAYLHAPAGTASASTSPVKFTLSAAVLNTTPEAGALEVNAAGDLFLTDATATRYEIAKRDHEFAEMYSYDNSAAMVIDVADEYHAVWTGIGNNDGTLPPNIDTTTWTYKAGASYAITSVTDPGGGTTITCVTAGHSLLAGEPITLTGSTNYDGLYIVLAAGLTATEFRVTAAYVATDTGSARKGATLLAGSSGVYGASFDVSGLAMAVNDVFKFELVRNITHMNNITAKFMLTTGSNFREGGSDGFINVTAGDYIWMMAKNLSGAGNVIIDSCNISLNRT